MGLRIVLVLIVVLSSMNLRVEGMMMSTSGLSFDFYKESCPQLEYVVRTALQSISRTDPTTPSSILRLFFHDCQVQGCDGSILVDGDKSEPSSSKNFGIRKRKSINLIKSMVETSCPEQIVSCADILVLAAREAVALSGGPTINVPLGRRDSSTPSNYRLSDASLPPPNSGVDAVLQMFSNKGMTVEESVAIMGAHTLGVTHCLNLKKRLYAAESYQNNEMDPRFEKLLKLTCPLNSLTSNISFVMNDPTPLLFDNKYYINLLNGRGLLTIDAQMPLHSRTSQFIQSFAADQDYFFQIFSSAFVKLSSSSVLTGKQGEIRRICNILN